MTLKIRNETASDVAAIEAVTIAAFHDAEHTSHTEHFIVNALRHAGQLTLSLVADDDGAVVGHVAISPIRLSIGPADWFGLGPLSVLPHACASASFGAIATPPVAATIASASACLRKGFGEGWVGAGGGTTG